MTNIIQFPLSRRMDEMIWQEIEKEMIEGDQGADEQALVEELLSEFISSLHELAYPIDEDKYVYDISFLYETIKSLVLKFHNKHHPIQYFAHNLYDEQIQKVKNEYKQLELDFD